MGAAVQVVRWKCKASGTHASSTTAQQLAPQLQHGLRVAAHSICSLTLPWLTRDQELRIGKGAVAQRRVNQAVALGDAAAVQLQVLDASNVDLRSARSSAGKTNQPACAGGAAVGLADRERLQCRPAVQAGGWGSMAGFAAAACCSGNRPALWQRAAAAWEKRCAGNEALQERLLRSRAAGSGRISPWDHHRWAGPLRPHEPQPQASRSRSRSTTTGNLPWGQSQPPWPQQACRLPPGRPVQALPPPPPPCCSARLRHPGRPRQHWSGAAQPCTSTHRARGHERRRSRVPGALPRRCLAV